MLVEVPYGEEGLKVEIDEKRVAGIFGANDVASGNEAEIIRRAIDSPVNSKSLASFLKGDPEILFIVNDGTRPTPTSRVLDVIYKDLKQSKVKFIIATGAHRPPTEDEYKQIFGQFLEECRPRIFVHKARNDGDMVYVSKTSRGTEVYINKIVAEAKKIVVIGSVEPHYFAGYTGGRKAFLPGTTGYKTIEQNHKLALNTSSKSLALDGNPVHDDMQDAFEIISKGKQIFSIMTVLDKDQRTYAASAGDMTDSFKAAAEKAKEAFVVKIPGKTDIVVTVARHPLDIDLYQSQKAIENGKLALKAGGTIILVSKCRCGIGDETFLKLLASCSKPEEVYKKIEDGYVLGYHKAAKLAEISQTSEIYGVTSLSDEIIRSALITPFPSLQEALDQALRLKGKNARVLFFLDGAMTVPSLE
jgi:lactate racemase